MLLNLDELAFFREELAVLGKVIVDLVCESWNSPIARRMMRSSSLLCRSRSAIFESHSLGIEAVYRARLAQVYGIPV